MGLQETGFGSCPPAQAGSLVSNGVRMMPREAGEKGRTPSAPRTNLLRPVFWQQRARQEQETRVEWRHLAKAGTEWHGTAWNGLEQPEHPHVGLGRAGFAGF